MNNAYGLDADYFIRLFQRELSPDVIRNQKPDDLARVLLRAARTASEKVFREPEFVLADTARLDFMLQKSRKLVYERLSHDNFEVYVEEGFFGKRYPCVNYSGTWDGGSPEGLEIQREAIDAAIQAAAEELV